MRLNVEIAGPEDAPALLMLHGFMSSRWQWAPNLTRLTQAYRVVLAELWGHGDSPAPADEAPYLPTGYAAEFEAIREELGIDRWAVCGQSFGAGLIVRYAALHPVSVRGVITTNSRAAFAPTLSDRAPRLNRAEWQAADLRRLPYHPRHARRFPADLRDRLSAAADRLDRHALWAAMAVTGPHVSCRDILPTLETPFLLINGLWERGFQADRQYVESVRSPTEIVDLEGGHSINIENAEGFDAAVLAFLGKLDRQVA